MFRSSRGPQSDPLCSMSSDTCILQFFVACEPALSSYSVRPPWVFSAHPLHKIVSLSFFLTVPCSVCDGLLQGARQYHIRYHASSNYCGPARACHRWSCTREPRYGAPCARGRPGRRTTDLGKQRKCGRRRARTAREAALTKREHEEGRHRKHLPGLGRGEAQRRGLLRGVQPGRSTATSTKGAHSPIQFHHPQQLHTHLFYSIL